MNKPLEILSLGAGVQSSVLALMTKTGELPTPDCAIFADTGAEPKGVYDQLEFLKKEVNFPIYVCMKDKGLLHALKNADKAKRFVPIPFYTRTPKSGKLGMARRQCTREFKIEPIIKKIRSLAGLKPYQRSKGVVANLWLGITTDEATRMSENRVKYIRNVFPLIEMGFSRSDCYAWLEKHNYKIPEKSSCTFCPYHSNGMWREMKQGDKASWDQAVQVDESLRKNRTRFDSELYVHRSGVPLKDAYLQEDQPNLFENECSGMCGT